MSQFGALFKKNYINWKRGTCGAICDVLFPILFAFLIVTFKRLSDDTEVSEKGYTAEFTSLVPTGASAALPFPQNYQQYIANMTLLRRIQLFK